MTKTELVSLMAAMLRAQMPEPTDETDSGHWRTEYAVSEAFGLLHEVESWFMDPK